MDPVTVYPGLKAQLYAAAAALFFNGICLLLFSLAVFFLRQTKTQASSIFLALSVVLVLFALCQVMIDVALAAMFSQFVQGAIDGTEIAGPVLSKQVANWSHLYSVRQALTVTNNAISDCLFLYRCAVIWASSAYAKIIIAIPALLVLATMIVGYVATFVISVSVNLPYSMALVTNVVLLGLTAGRIWSKGRDATLLLGPRAGQRYTNTIAIICESSLLYVVTITLYLITVNAQEASAPLPNLVWGAIAQVVNIVPMMIIVRVGIAKNYSEQQSRGSGGSVPLSSARSPLIFKGRNEAYSESDL
ncbi:hypothetical protein DFH09DRAFT_1141235 [Mycena vulgaris]|nr:hypothetical protein DFH09DRAFT_1141235 [Mycena vulgaris]